MVRGEHYELHLSLKQGTNHFSKAFLRYIGIDPQVTEPIPLSLLIPDGNGVKRSSPGCKRFPRA